MASNGLRAKNRYRFRFEIDIKKSPVEFDGRFLFANVSREVLLIDDEDEHYDCTAHSDHSSTFYPNVLRFREVVMPSSVSRRQRY